MRDCVCGCSHAGERHGNGDGRETNDPANKRNRIEKRRDRDTDRHRETGFGERLDRVEVWCRRFSDHLLPSVVPSFPTSIVRATFRNCSASSGFDPASIANADGAAALAPPFFFFFFLGIFSRRDLSEKTPKNRYLGVNGSSENRDSPAGCTAWVRPGFGRERDAANEFFSARTHRAGRLAQNIEMRA